MEHRHQAVDGLFNLFTKANHDLAVLHIKLEKEFQQTYPDNANPMKLVARIKKIQADVSSLKEQCRELLEAKQGLIDKARMVLVGNRSMLQKLQASTRIPVTDDSSDSAYSNFSQIIEEWTVQVRSKTEDEKLESGTEDINHLLFSAIVPEN
ncbi:OLC1v1030494C2 [Oldenlandia corymbosa var. corymbosa]|uniref:Protein FAM33A n=1 Tax=Oldenlandia corymbosa var. corymbosa TaxID=529605 RepID=A0AAV1CJI7_OLDCO|nr:OLC1v1030494C2 [Oldenlandia corymbosa var. corymbosa]